MDTLAGKLKKKGVDGFFVDNCDVYDYAHKNDIFDGLTVILKKIRARLRCGILWMPPPVLRCTMG